MDRLLRLPEVQEITGYKRSSIYKKIEDGTFPRPVPLGNKAVGWIAREIEAWVQSRIKLRGVADGKTQ
jgi:prophage regulatory protein